ncbi:maleylpyruvate isomerase family mycothiol-dependent enzyme [Kribbella sp. NPDC023855]|uniref:maleylpyruvate isomerase family mycothiol-dependent enzyme n=1 Tax=Kribbella sp. NPDC023855 TaxID=3154698 RepID=UPI0033CF3315
MSSHDVLRANDIRFLAQAEKLLDSDWYRPSLCAGWSNLDVLAHLVVGCSVPASVLIGQVLRHRGSFDRANDAVTHRLARSSTPSELLKRYELLVSKPEGIGKLFPSALLTGDHVLHEIDILLPLGQEPAIERAALIAVLNTEVNHPNPFVPAHRTAKGLRLVASDINWSTGPASGPVVEGPGWAIASVLANRPHALDRLEGPGVHVLTRRLRANGHVRSADELGLGPGAESRTRSRRAVQESAHDRE